MSSISKKKVLALVLSVAMVFALVACGGDTTSEGENEGEVIVVRIGHPAGDISAYHQAAVIFEEEVEAASEGRVDVQVFPLGQLGSEREMGEAVQLGTQEMVISYVLPFGNFVPAVLTMEMPFLFSTRDQVYAAFDGELGDALVEACADAGFTAFGFGGYGFKNVSNNHQTVTSVSDMQGLKIRTQENEMILKLYELMGSDPTPMATSEVYGAIQTGVVDGYDGAYEAYVDFKLYEVAPKMTELKYAYASTVIAANTEWFTGLPEDIQAIITEGADNWVVNQREINRVAEEKSDGYIQTCLDNGCEIVTYDQVDIDSFKAATEEIYSMYPELAPYIEIAKKYVD